MAYTLSLATAEDGTTRVRLSTKEARAAAPVPRELILDGHVTQLHADLRPVLAWLCWPRLFRGAFSFNAGISEPMSAALSRLPNGQSVQPYNTDKALAPRTTTDSILALGPGDAPGRGRNRIGAGRSTYVRLLPIADWRGRLLSNDSLTVSTNAHLFAATSWPRGGDQLAGLLAAAIVYADAFRSNRIVAAGFAPDPRWLAVTEHILTAAGLQLTLLDPSSAEWREVVEP